MLHQGFLLQLVDPLEQTLPLGFQLDQVASNRSFHLAVTRLQLSDLSLVLDGNLALQLGGHGLENGLEQLRLAVLDLSDPLLECPRLHFSQINILSIV